MRLSVLLRCTQLTRALWGRSTWASLTAYTPQGYHAVHHEDEGALANTLTLRNEQTNKPRHIVRIKWTVDKPV